MGKAVVKRKPAEERKAEIVDATIRLAAEIGPDRLTTDRLAQEVGISQAAIFRHFPSKSDIWEAVGKNICELLGALPGASQSDKSRAEQLGAMVSGQLKFISRTPAVPAILFSRELHAENETLRLFFVKMMGQRHARLSAIIQSGKEEGEFSSSLDCDNGAFLILSLIQGLAMRWSLNGRNFDLAKEGEVLLSLLLKSFAPN